MKRIVTFLSILTLLLSMSACGEKRCTRCGTVENLYTLDGKNMICEECMRPSIK